MLTAFRRSCWRSRRIVDRGGLAGSGAGVAAVVGLLLIAGMAVVIRSARLLGRLATAPRDHVVLRGSVAKLRASPRCAPGPDPTAHRHRVVVGEVGHRVDVLEAAGTKRAQDRDCCLVRSGCPRRPGCRCKASRSRPRRARCSAAGRAAPYRSRDRPAGPPSATSTLHCPHGGWSRLRQRSDPARGHRPGPRMHWIAVAEPLDHPILLKMSSTVSVVQPQRRGPAGGMWWWISTRPLCTGG